MSKIEIDEHISEASISQRKDSIWTILGTITGIISLIVGVFAWLVLYHNQWLGLLLASISIVLSFVGFKGRWRNFAVGGLVVSGTLLIVVGIMYAAFYYIFNSVL